jgi:deazaflavin-dependent oxidoreductase (nitroreductase family)
MGLRHVDPHRHRSPLYRALCRLSATGPGLWLSATFAWKLDPFLMKVTRGRFSSAGPLPAALLETRGARTGRPRRTATLYFHDGERVTIIASKAGRPEHPAWYHNLRANPDVLYGGLPFRAELIEDEAESKRLWELADRVFPPFARYREWAAQAGRTIPIVQLVPH